MASNVELLAELNFFRATEKLAPFADWRKARHQPMLDAYKVKAAELKKILDAAEFEATPDELAAQEGRPTAEEVTKTAQEILAGVVDASIFTADTDSIATTEEAAPVENPAAPEKMKSYKQVANYNKSSMESPVAFIHSFLSANPTLSRKAAVIALTSEHGINYSTARTQYQRWFTANKAAK